MNGLLLACKNKMINLVLKLLENPSIDLSHMNSKRENVLSLACRNGFSNIVNIFT